MTPELKSMIANVPCPDCGQLSPEPIERIVENDVIPCSLCAGLIDLTVDDCQSIVSDARRLLQSKSGKSVRGQLPS
jgi:hypothetical protein